MRTGRRFSKTSRLRWRNEESRRWLSRTRAWKEEYDVCSSLPQSLSVPESEFVEFARSEKHDDQLMKVLRNVLVVQTTVQTVCHKAMWSGTSSTVAVRGL